MVLFLVSLVLLPVTGTDMLLPVTELTGATGRQVGVGRGERYTKNGTAYGKL